MRSVRYKAQSIISCGFCDKSFTSSQQLNAHAKKAHTGVLSDNVNSSRIPVIDDLSLMDLSDAGIPHY